MNAPLLGGADHKTVGTAFASTLSYIPGAKLEPIAFATVSTCEDTEDPFSNSGMACNDHIRFTIDPAKFAQFLEACATLGHHPGQSLQDAFDLCFDAEIALAAFVKGEEE